MNKKITMKDIADLSGVGKSTVSRYFNGGYVKEDTKETIRKIIEEYNYQPNAFAQSLKAKQSKLIGVIAPCLDSTVSSRIMMAIDAYLRKEGYTSLIINTNHKRQLELDNLESLWHMNVDGIILIATQITDEHKEIIEKIDIPVVVVGQEYKDGISIINNDLGAGLAIGSYAVEMGHQNIVYLGVDEDDEAVGKTRKNAVIEGCKRREDVQLHLLTTDFNFYHSYELIMKTLDELQPDMIICATDMIALGAFKAIQEKNYKVPEDISLVGFGGYEISSLLTPKLTTIKFDNVKAGEEAAKTIIHMIQDEDVRNCQIIDYMFIKGESVSRR